VIFLVTASISSVYNNTPTPAVFALFFVLTFAAVIQTSHATAVRFVEIASRMFAVFIVMALIGVLYHLAGGGPLFSLVNADGRDNAFYLTTFSNAETFIIRPSAIYDEPGAFSFYICMVVAMRSLLGMSRKTSGWLLLGGLITQSITHVMFALLWVAWAALISPGRKLKSANVFVAGAFVAAAALIYWIGVLDWALERALEFYENPWLNPRQRSFDDIVYGLREGGFWFGFDPQCTRRLAGCSDLGENPLTPLIYGGMAAAWPYYLFLLAAFCAPLFSRSGLLYAGIGVLLLQRPYLLEFPYSAVFGLLFVIAIGPPATTRPRRRPSMLRSNETPPKEPGHVRPRQ